MNLNRIAKRAALEIKPNQIINLGIGLPTELIKYLPDDMDVMIHSENGVLGTWKKARKDEARPELIDAGGNYVTTRAGSSGFDSSVSFAMMRRSKLDVSFMGAVEVDAAGNLANWKIPGRFSPGIGGAMELAQKTANIVVLCSHVDKAGRPKIKETCSFPLTAEKCVSRIITDMAVMDVTEGGLVLREIVDDVDVEALINMTEAKLIIPDNLIRYQE